MTAVLGTRCTPPATGARCVVASRRSRPSHRRQNAIRFNVLPAIMRVREIMFPVTVLVNHDALVSQNGESSRGGHSREDLRRQVRKEDV
jgi:hypothetical protein